MLRTARPLMRPLWAAPLALSLTFGALFMGTLPAPAAAQGAIAQGVPLSPALLEARIRGALPAAVRGKGSTIRVNNSGRVLLVAANANLDEVKISRLNYDERSGSFNATLTLPTQTGLAYETVTGRIDKTARIPVLIGALKAGDVIGQADLTWLDIPARQVTANMVTDPAELIGMAVRRPLGAQAVIRPADVQQPLLVKRGALVTMIVSTPSLTLTAVGRALENGSKGDRIHLVNTASNTSVEGVVLSAREVQIVSATRVASLQY